MIAVGSSRQEVRTLFSAVLYLYMYVQMSCKSAKIPTRISAQSYIQKYRNTWISYVGADTIADIIIRVNVLQRACNIYPAIICMLYYACYALGRKKPLLNPREIYLNTFSRQKKNIQHRTCEKKSTV